MLFISDLHLCATRPAISHAFLDFLSGPGSNAEALYILGDLFEAWAGDDDINDPFNRSIVDGLATLSDHGTSVFVLHGNRDFLLGEDFSRLTGTHLLPDPALIDVAGCPTLVLHGDTLCTGDTAYLAFREKVRTRTWIDGFLAQPLAARKTLIEGLRRQSDEEKSRKPMAAMDVDQTAVENLVRRHGYPRLIHGHTHLPAKHVFEVDGRRCERWVLKDWYQTGGYLRCTEASWESVNL
ncbi:MAG: UDP-2,3-diacylglucosamine diphosphatase [Rhodocyclaceae bacterium]